MNVQQTQPPITSSINTPLNNLFASYLKAKLSQNHCMGSFDKKQKENFLPSSPILEQIGNQMISEQSSEQQKQNQDAQFILPQRKLTTEKKILIYFRQFLYNISNPNLTQITAPLKKTSHSHQTPKLTKLELALQKMQKKLEKFPHNKNLQKQTPIKSKITHDLKQFQLTHKKDIDQILIHSTIINKMRFFTSDLIITHLNPSQNHQIFSLDLHLLEYQISVTILNEPINNPLDDFNFDSESGGSGKVYFTKALNKEVAIKSIYFPTKSFLGQCYEIKIAKISAILKEYFFVVLFSQLQIGPKVKTLGGFNLIMYNDSIIFATQICQSLSQKSFHHSEISENLFQMHMLQIVHRDIKPQNIMFSKAYQKVVFIDFGCTAVIRQNLGQKSWSKLAGTLSYCSDQMKKLRFQGPGQVDLYYNDVYGLNCSLKQLARKKDSIENFNYILGVLAKKSRFEGMINVKFPIFQVFEMKYCLYTNDFQEFRKLWRQMKFEYSDQLFELQNEILQFIPEVKFSNELKHFYMNELDQQIKSLQSFNQIGIALKMNDSKFERQLCNFKDKQKRFRQFSLSYQNISIEFANEKQKAKQYKRIVSTRQNIENFFEHIRLNLNNEELPTSTDLSSIIDAQKDQLSETMIKLCFAVARFSSLSHCKYEISLENKIQACQMAINLLELYQKDKMIEFKPIYECNTIPKYRQLARFHQFYLFFVIKELDCIDKSTQISNSLLTLIFLGYPFHEYHCYLNTFQNVFKNMIEQNQSQPESEQTKIDRITSFWVFQLIFGIFSNTQQSPIQSNKMDFNQYPELWQSMIELKNNFLYFQHQSSNEVLRLHGMCLEHLQSRNAVVNQERAYEFLSIIKSQKVKNQTFKQHSYKNLWSILTCYFFICLKPFSQGFGSFLDKNIEEEMVFPFEGLKDVLPFLCLMKISSEGWEKQGFRDRLVRKTNSIINCEEVTQRLWVPREFKTGKSEQQVQNMLKFIN